MKKKKPPTESTLNVFLQGTKLSDKVVKQVKYAPKSRVTRDVEFVGDGTKRIQVPVLQDYLLITKGYEPKYSGKDREWFEKRGAVPKPPKK